MIAALQMALTMLIVVVIYGAWGFLYNLADGSPFIWPVMLLAIPVAPFGWIAGSTIAFGDPKAILKKFSKVLRASKPNSN
jgi:hypothetical protein